MKLRCFISLIATMVIASTAGSMEIYNNNGNVLSVFGNIVEGQCISKNSANNGNNSFIRYGLTHKSEINNKIFGFSTWQNELSLQNIEGAVNILDNNHSILGYIGVNFSNFGSIDYGRNYGVLHDVSSWSDIITEFGGDLSIPDNFLANRASNVITYRNNNFFGFVNGFDFAMQYQMKNNINARTGRTVKTANGEGYGISASYKIGNGIATSVAYANSKRICEQKNLDGAYTADNAEAYSVGLKYDAHNMYIAATYAENYNMIPFGDFKDSANSNNIYGFINKAINVEVVAQYRFGFGLIPSVSYMHLKANDVENGYGNYLKKYITVGTSYAFNNNVSTSVDYRMNLLSKTDFITAAKICTDDLFAFGVSYLF